MPSKFGRRNGALSIARRTEAYEAELQHVVSAVEDFAEALYVGEKLSQAEVDTLSGNVEKLRVSVAIELADMQQTNEMFQVGIEAELAQLQRQAAEDQRAARRAEEACAGFKIALAGFLEQQARWFRRALQERTERNSASPTEWPAHKGVSAAHERLCMEHCWCAVEAAAASMGEDFAQCLPLMRQAVAQVEWAVALDDMPLEPLELPVPFGSSEVHVSGSGTDSEEAEGRDWGSQPREDRGGWKHATWSRRCRCPARAERRLLRRRRWKRLMRALRGKG